MLSCTCFACGDGGLVTRVKADRLIDWLMTNWKCVCACRYICSFYSLYSLQICNSPFVITSFSHTQQGWFSSEMTKKRSQMDDTELTLQHNRRRTSGHYTAGLCSINPGVQSLSAARGLGPSINRWHRPWSPAAENKPVAWNQGNSSALSVRRPLASCWARVISWVWSLLSLSLSYYCLVASCSVVCSFKLLFSSFSLVFMPPPLPLQSLSCTYFTSRLSTLSRVRLVAYLYSHTSKMLGELVPLLRCSHGTISCFPLCLAFVQMSAKPGEHVPASAACCPACGLEEAWTTAAAGTPLVHLTSLLPTVYWRRNSSLTKRETGVTVSQHSQWTAILWDCTVKQVTIAGWTTCAFDHFITSCPLPTRVQKNRAPFC